jgi:hypothetical protein
MLINTIPTSVLLNANPTRMRTKHTARNEKVPKYIEESLLIGLKTGSVLFLDTLNNCDVQTKLQAHTKVVHDFKYRKHRKELFVLGESVSEEFFVFSVRIWKLPDLEFLFEVSDPKTIS